MWTYVKLDNPSKAEDFVNKVSQFDDGDLTLNENDRVVNARSLLGVLSLNLKEPLEFHVNADRHVLTNVVKSVAPYIIKA